MDILAARSEELDSRTNIMQNSMFTVLNKKIDDRLIGLLEVVQGCSNSYEKSKVDVENQVRALSQENRDTRNILETNAHNIRHNITRPVLNNSSSSDSADSSHNSSNSRHDISPSDRKLDDLQASIKSMQELTPQMDIRLTETEQNSRRESLVFAVVPADIPQNELQSKVLEIMFHLVFTELGPDDIVAVHRLWQPRDERGPARVIVKFLNRKVVEWSLDHQDNLVHVWNNMGLNLQMSQSICSKNNESLRICKWLIDEGKNFKFFTRNGFPKIVVRAGDRPLKIKHPKVLLDKFNVPTDINFS